MEHLGFQSHSQLFMWASLSSSEFHHHGTMARSCRRSEQHHVSQQVSKNAWLVVTGCHEFGIFPEMTWECHTIPIDSYFSDGFKPKHQPDNEASTKWVSIFSHSYGGNTPEMSQHQLGTNYIFVTTRGQQPVFFGEFRIFRSQVQKRPGESWGILQMWGGHLGNRAESWDDQVLWRL